MARSVLGELRTGDNVTVRWAGLGPVSPCWSLVGSEHVTRKKQAEHEMERLGDDISLRVYGYLAACDV